MHTLEIIQQTLEFFSSTLSPIFRIRFQYRFGVFFFIQKMQWVSKEASSSIWHSYIFHSPKFALSIEVRRVHCVIINTVVGGYYYLRNFWSPPFVEYFCDIYIGVVLKVGPLFRTCGGGLNRLSTSTTSQSIKLV